MIKDESRVVVGWLGWKFPSFFFCSEKRHAAIPVWKKGGGGVGGGGVQTACVNSLFAMLRPHFADGN